MFVMATGKEEFYADELMKRLEMSGLGCYIGHIFVGTLCYADDMKFLSPTRKGLQKMFDICKEFGIEFDVNSNKKKTMAICFSVQGNDSIWCIFKCKQ